MSRVQEVNGHGITFRGFSSELLRSLDLVGYLSMPGGYERWEKMGLRRVKSSETTLKDLSNELKEPSYCLGLMA